MAKGQEEPLHRPKTKIPSTQEVGRVVLQRWDPIFDFRRMNKLMNRRWQHFHFPYYSTVNGDTEHGNRENRDWALPVDVVEEGNDFLVRASLPGVKLEDIDVSIEDRVLTIKAAHAAEAEHTENGYLVRERRTGSFHRSLRLSEAVDADKAKTAYENGVLTVSLPKVESKKARRLEITAVESSKSLAGDKK